PPPPRLYHRRPPSRQPQPTWLAAGPNLQIQNQLFTPHGPPPHRVVHRIAHTGQSSQRAASVRLPLSLLPSQLQKRTERTKRRWRGKWREVPYCLTSVTRRRKKL
ncbi:unnamed protein product, partial [Ixodes persulcatus]